jgi:hypothetical protein
LRNQESIMQAIPQPNTACTDEVGSQEAVDVKWGNLSV